ncbi:MAG TPA: hypothetical protein PLF13_14930 [candidate division Zixibacteria bacterium]|jgi:purine-cytosine permease-like protein|nr:hypothetical protein [candidate division Zixibacteria bacterium]
MTEKKRIELTKLQGVIAIASFTTGVVIAAVCLFWVPPLGEIANSAISIVSELLVLCGAILGVKASYDTKLRKFEAELRQVIDNENKNND